MRGYNYNYLDSSVLQASHRLYIIIIMLNLSLLLFYDYQRVSQSVMLLLCESLFFYLQSSSVIISMESQICCHVILKKGIIRNEDLFKSLIK